MDAPAASTSAGAPAAPEDMFASAQAALTEAARVGGAMLALLRAELRLARSSALALVGFALALVLLGAGAWLATSAAIVVGIQALTGSLLLGLVGVALANMVGAIFALLAIRTCWRDLGLPRTRRVITQIGREAA